MFSRLKNIHLIAGLILLVIFPLTGTYLRSHIPQLLPEDDRLRFSMRGNHIYILLSSLIHLSLGAYLRISASKWLSRIQTGGSVLLLLSAILVVVAFFYEPKHLLERPMTLLAMVLALVGTLLHVLCVLIDRSPERSRP